MASSLVAERPAYYPALTGIRAIAAYLVFFVHFRPPGLPEPAGRVLTAMFVTLSMFFVLSGFVIASRYQDNVQLTRGWWREYFWRRMARVYPVYFVLNGSALFHVYWPWPEGKTANTLLLISLSQSMLRGFSNTLKYVGLPQGWSLTPEECFYFWVPLMLVLWQRRGQLAAVGFVLATFATGVALTLLCRGRPELHGLFGTWHHLFNFTFFGRVFEFVLGVGLARWWGGQPLGQAAGRPWLTLAGLLWMAATVAVLAWLNSPQTPYDGNLYPSTIFLNIIIFPTGATLFMAGLLVERSWVRRLLALPLIHALGQRSLIFYLLHVGVFSIWWHDTFGWGQHVFLQFFATIALAEIGHRLWEAPMYRWILARTVGYKKQRDQFDIPPSQG